MTTDNIDNFERHLLVTGGAGFIGSHLVRRLVNRYPRYLIVNYDLLTYAGNLENLKDVEAIPNYRFVKGDICDMQKVRATISEYEIDGIINLAAESHVDRSILNPSLFAHTNVMGTITLLQCATEAWKDNIKGKMFYHVSTDEVYGALPADGGFFTEQTPYNPHSPYSASKASSDHFVRAWHDTYNLPVIISNCSNNYGPNQFPEKLIPLFINNIRLGKKLPVYGEGLNVRDWLYVEDHASAIDLLFHNAPAGETVNIGGSNEWRNIDLVKLLIRTVDECLGNPEGYSDHLITYVRDRAGHDLRYAIDAGYLKEKYKWQPSVNFEQGLRLTVEWYLNNSEWMDSVTSGQYINYYNSQYGRR